MASQQFTVCSHRSVEWTLTAQGVHADPWREITVTATLAGPDGTERRVPAFWDGGDTWRLRLTADRPGVYAARTVCSDPDDAGLHGQEARIEVQPADLASANPLYCHGAVRIAPDGRSFQHADGTPFHWLADTWWMLMSERVSWPEGFARLTARRVEQGFSVVQTVVGFQPDTTPFDGRDDNAGGPPWLADYAALNPAYFQACDRRLEHLIEQGIVPCILGSWGYHLLFMGAERMAEHWRYLVARYAAWPVIFCLAGEGAMPYYLSGDGPADSERLKAAWPGVARVVRETDPWRRPLTLHPRRYSFEDTAEPDTLDFHMVQVGHMANAPVVALEALAEARRRHPDRLVVNAEPPYEGHGATNGPDVQRYSFWSSLLSGAAGYTYGAAGIFQANDRDRPTGDRPDGGAFDSAFWDDAMLWPGAAQIAAGHALLRELPLERFEPHPEWVKLDLRWGREAYHLPPHGFAAGVPGECRVCYLPLRWYHWDGPLVRELEPDVPYEARYVAPDTLVEYDLGVIRGDASGQWRGPTLPTMQDWVLVLKRAAAPAMVD